MECNPLYSDPNTHFLLQKGLDEVYSKITSLAPNAFNIVQYVCEL